MNERDALRAITVLAELTTGRWDEVTVRTWMAELVKLEDPQVAEETSRLVAKSWTQPGRPPFGSWMAEYQRARQRVLTMPALPSGRKPMGPAEYIRSLMERADKGEAAALTELGNWRRSCWGLSLLDQEALELLGIAESDYRWKLRGGV